MASGYNLQEVYLNCVVFFFEVVPLQWQLRAEPCKFATQVCL